MPEDQTVARTSLALGTVGAIPLIIKDESALFRVVAGLIAVVLTALFLRALRLRRRGHLDPVFATLVVVLALCTLIPLVAFVHGMPPRRAVERENGLASTVTHAAPTTLQGTITTPEDHHTTRPPTLFLVGRRAVSNTGWVPGELQLDAQLYTDALVATACPTLNLAPPSVLYVIDRKYSTFRAIAGISDYARTSGYVTFIIRGDGSELYRESTNVGHPLPIEVPIAGVLRLELAIAYTKSTDDCDGGTLVAWAEARAE